MDGWMESKDIKRDEWKDGLGEEEACSYSENAERLKELLTGSLVALLFIGSVTWDKSLCLSGPQSLACTMTEVIGYEA